MLDFDAEDLGIPDKTTAVARLPKPDRDPYPGEFSPIKRRHYELRELAQHTSNSVEHYTPIDILEAVRGLMGGIDCDPASSYVAQQRVRAESWCGVQQDGSRTDGLMADWKGKVWLNPPGGSTAKHAPHLSSISKSYACIWWGKLVSEYHAGNAVSACFLGFSLELLQSIQNVRGVDHPLQYPTVFFRKRIPFDYPEDTQDGKPIGETEIAKGTQPTHANFLTWLPPKDWDDRTVHLPFQKQFAPFGFVKA